MLTSVHVLMMTSEQRGWYNMMLDNQWNSPKCMLVNEPELIIYYAGINPGNAAEIARFNATGQAVLNRFETSPDGKYIYNQRMMDEYDAILTWRLECQRAGKKSGKVRNAKKEQELHDEGALNVPSTDPEGSPKQTETIDRDNRQETREIQKQPPRSLALTLELPVWLPEKEWGDYQQMRVRIQRPMTNAAKRLAIKKLENLMGRGHPPEAVLNQSIFNSWKELFELKDGGSNGQTGQTGRNQSNAGPPLSAAQQRRDRIITGTAQSLGFAAHKTATGDAGDRPRSLAGLDGSPRALPAGDGDRGSDPLAPDLKGT